MRKISSKVLVTCISGVLLFYGVSWSQIVYPPTIRVPVTFYDYHSDGSNPDFEPGLHLGGTIGAAQNLGLHANEVATTLDTNRKPILGTAPYFSQRVAKWFRPWTPGDFTVPVYSAAGAYLNDATSTLDTAYKNVVIPDSLTFTLVAGSAGAYQLNNQAFFVLDGRGFGADDPGGQNPPHNFGFAMELHWEFTYQTGLNFNFSGDDDVWVFINGQRVIDLGGMHGAATAQVNLNAPNNLGMVVGQKYMLDLFYAERHVVASDILITTNIISAQPALIKIVPSIKDTIPAGAFKPVQATVLDETLGVRHEFDRLINWTLTPAGTSSSISATVGGVDTFFARQAYTTYIIGASYAVSPTNILRAFDTIYVRPGPDQHVWIEPDANINVADTSPQMKARLQHPDTVSLVQMLSTETQKSVVGVVRDLYGNFTRLASNAQWTEAPITTSIISPANGTPAYIGLINRINATDSGLTNLQVSAKNLTTGADLVPDQTLVRLMLGYITKLKFVNVATHVDITSINMNTDQDIQIMVMGVLSTDADTNHWIDVTALWSLANNVFASVFSLPATSADQWHFSPTKPGGVQPWSGPSLLTATTGAGATLRTATIPMVVTSAPPSFSDEASFKIITPPDSIIAGVPFRAVVSIYNKDGLVPGQYCYPATSGSSAIYQDSLGKGTTPDPTVTTAGGSGTINQTPSQTSQVAECFNNGLDTISITLYRAPYHSVTDPIDSMHQLVVVLGPLSATTGPFKLLPGPLYKLQLQNVAGVHLTGIDTLAYPSGAITVYSVGYDQFGNKRGREVSNWSVNGTMHQPGQTIGVSQVYYDASQAAGDERGLLLARALRFAVLNDSTGDSLGFFIKGPPAALDSAVTRDMSGNGYLDEIELYFSKRVTFPQNFSLSNFTISYTSANSSRIVTVLFAVDSIDAPDTSGTKYALHLVEDSTSLPGSPQTAWRPYVNITGMGNPSSVPATMCKDGAGPVIWEVMKTIANVSDRTQDVVRVKFSEPIQGPSGSQFTPATIKPSTVLADYRRDTTGTWDTAGNLSPGLAANGADSLSINSFSRMVNDSTLEFVMSNGKDLTPNDFLAINAAANLIFDGRSRFGGGPGVAPVRDNRKARVIILTNPRVVRNIVYTAPFVNAIQSYRGFFIAYGGYSREKVSVRIYSIKGQLVQTISGTEQANGLIVWNYYDKFERPVTNGCYIIRISAGAKAFKQKIILSR